MKCKKENLFVNKNIHKRKRIKAGENKTENRGEEQNIAQARTPEG